MTPDTVLLAHHPLLLAVPAFVPAIAITVVVLVIARRDRIAEARETAAQETAAPTVQELDR
ncbi:hypothetical protein FE697_004105 [Mumia zhuanghuii]|uniref:Uncharacterized protein n=2 Tax=Mumia TaxID=1546255 RepID=A0ABW1QT12_9ACTN|nr:MULTISPECIES: hypothetical protein [Mumia]KAA1425073.1 hypothetical protein FE697_004105 [Mumia zhuanghuii]